MPPTLIVLLAFLAGAGLGRATTRKEHPTEGPWSRIARCVSVLRVEEAQRIRMLHTWTGVKTDASIEGLSSVANVFAHTAIRLAGVWQRGLNAGMLRSL